MCANEQSVTQRDSLLCIIKALPYKMETVAQTQAVTNMYFKY